MIHRNKFGGGGSNIPTGGRGEILETEAGQEVGGKKDSNKERINVWMDGWMDGSRAGNETETVTKSGKERQNWVKDRTDS